MERFAHWWEQLAIALLFAAVGFVIGIGQSLAGENPPPRRIMIGRSLATSGLAMAAGVVLIWVPDLPVVGLIGVAALLASLGTAGLERMFQRVVQGRA